MSERKFLVGDKVKPTVGRFRGMEGEVGRYDLQAIQSQPIDSGDKEEL